MTFDHRFKLDGDFLGDEDGSEIISVIADSDFEDDSTGNYPQMRIIYPFWHFLTKKLSVGKMRWNVGITSLKKSPQMPNITTNVGCANSTCDSNTLYNRKYTLITY